MRLNDIVKLAKETPFYQQIFDGCSCFEEFPVIDKRMVKNNPPDVLSHVNNGRIVKTSTSGSSGMPLDIFWHELEYYQSLSEVWKIRMRTGIYPTDRYCTVHVTMDVNGSCCGNKVIITKNNLSLSKCYSDPSTMRYYHRVLHEFLPKWMMVQPSFIYNLALSFESQNLRLPDSIKLIELTGELCGESVLEKLKALYPNIRWTIAYGMQEFNVIAYGDTPYLYVMHNNVHVEILDENNLPVAPGETGRIVVTGLKNTLMPLVRYETGDLGHYDSDKRLFIDRARSNDPICFNGQMYDGSLFLAIVLLFNASHGDLIRQFQVKLVDDTLEFNFLLNNDSSIDKEVLEDYIKRYLYEHYKSEYFVKVNLVDQIKLYKTRNKIKYFINTTYKD